MKVVRILYLLYFAFIIGLLFQQFEDFVVVTHFETCSDQLVFDLSKSLLDLDDLVLLSC